MWVGGYAQVLECLCVCVSPLSVSSMSESEWVRESYLELCERMFERDIVGERLYDLKNERGRERG